MRLGIFSAVLLAAIATRAPSQVQVIRGRVLGDSARGVAGAVVSVTMAPDRSFKQDTTRADGRWEVRFERASGDYLVHIAALGHQAFRKRVTVPTSDSVVTVDATLAAVVQQLAAVQVTARRQRPARENDGLLPDNVSNEQNATFMLNGAVSPDVVGDLTALAGIIPGLSVTGSGVSAFGLDPSQNTVTLNGMSFPGSAIPRNAQTSTRFITSAYDPAKGGFAGVETAVTLQKGFASTNRRAQFTLDAPALQATDARSAQLGSRVTAGVGSFGTTGEWVEDKWYYNLALDVSRRVSDAPSLLNADANLLSLSGVAADSASRLLQTLSRLGVPTLGRSAALRRATNDATFAMRIDHAPYKPQSFEESPSTWGVVAMGRIQQRDALGIGLTSTPARGSELSNVSGAVQFLYSTFVEEYKLSETKTGISLNHSRTEPYLQLPNGSVLVSSQLPDGTVGTSSLGFGGGAGNIAEETQVGWETISNFQWYVRGAHLLKVTANSKFDTYHQTPSGNTLGSYSFASLADLAANTPSLFSRTLFQPDRTGNAWTGFASIGDAWKPTPMLQVVYGARVEGNRYLSTPAFNPEVERAFGVRTDAAPSHVHVSPRLGFSWRYTGGSGYNGFSVSNLGARVLSPTGMLRGGIGEFRSSLPTQLMAVPLVSTGLSGAEQRLLCVGSAVPTPDWQSFLGDENAIPTTCLNAGNAFADASPAVRVIDPSFDAPRSWRGNLSWMSVIKSTAITVDGALSWNLNQGSSVDVNFNGTTQFTLADEGRPVFSSASSIVPTSGALSAIESRRTSAFASVMSRRSDLTSFTKQVTLSLQPLGNIGAYWLSGSYTLASTRGHARGFDGAAFGDPRLVEDARSDYDIRHRVQLQLGKALPRNSSVTFFLNASSGAPYTPLVNGDVNGDGRSFDRAFVFDPAHVSDPAFAAALRSVLASRPCLTEQLGKPAAKNSCEGPWTASATARLAVLTGSLFTGRRANVAFSITNPLGGIDQVLHGDDVRGWGMNVPPDPVLMTVRGFDPATNRFRYEVNPRFGSTSPAQTTVRLPFRVSVDITLDLRPTPGRQQVERVMNRGRNGHAGARLSADSIRKRFARNVNDPYAQVLQLSDSLLLSREQVAQLREGQARYQARADSVWMPLARELATMGDGYDASAVTSRVDATTDAVWEVARQESLRIGELLSPLQLTLGPGLVRYLMTVKGKIGMRTYSY